MEALAKTVEQILNQYAQECMGNRLNQFTFGSLKNVILGEIVNYKPGQKVNSITPVRPIIKPIISVPAGVGKEEIKKDKRIKGEN